MRRGLSPQEERRIEELLAETRLLRPAIDVSGRVMASIAEIRPGGAHLPTERQLGWGLAASLAACLGAVAGMTGLLLSAPAGAPRGLLVAGVAACKAILQLLRQGVETLAPIARALLALLNALAIPAERGRLPLLLPAEVSVACLVILALAAAALVWRDLHGPEASVHRRIA